MTINTHDFYTDADKDIPASICDAHGSVVLDLCKKCNKAENQLTPNNCLPSDTEMLDWMFLNLNIKIYFTGYPFRYWVSPKQSLKDGTYTTPREAIAAAMLEDNA